MWPRFSGSVSRLKIQVSGCNPPKVTATPEAHLRSQHSSATGQDDAELKRDVHLPATNDFFEGSGEANSVCLPALVSQQLDESGKRNQEHEDNQCADCLSTLSLGIAYCPGITLIKSTSASQLELEP